MLTVRATGRREYSNWQEPGRVHREHKANECNVELSNVGSTTHRGETESWWKSGEIYSKTWEKIKLNYNDKGV